MRDRGRPRNSRGGVVVGLGIHLGKNRAAGPQWGMLWGGLIAVIGLALLLDNLNIFPAVRIYRFWPLILVVAGIINITRGAGRFVGVILLTVGVFFQLSELGLAHFGWAQMWPVILIAVGVLVMWSSLEARKRLSNPENQPPLPGFTGASSAGAASGDLRNTLNEVAVFAGVERRLFTNDFRGGTVNAIFGGVELDLSHADMQQQEATLEINAIFGGVELRVPEHWHVVSAGQAFFGGYDDKTGATDLPNANEPPKKTLLLTGSVVFGGVEIKS